RLEELDDEIQALGGSATLTPMDLTKGDDIDRLGAAIHERWGHLDILIGNAGDLGALSPLPHTDPDDWDKVMAINLTANWRLIRSLDPLLRAADNAHVVFLTSSVGHQPRAYWSAYAVSKAGLEMLANIYAAETRKSGMKVNLLNPGGTRTAMRAKAMPGEDPDTLPSPDDIAPLILEMVSPEFEQTGALINYRDWVNETA
ncbi:MAG: SDR family NAD(P)-dependent oxidoreductase, partial [Alphaproteobacteria bacterium]|nr:SDR family NAD(P)-dependent oxidoreductase [Alphaproteobacteria bacterium]